MRARGPCFLGDLREFATPICASFLLRAWGSDLQRGMAANTQGHLLFSKLCAVGLTESISGVGGKRSSYHFMVEETGPEWVSDRPKFAQPGNGQAGLKPRPYGLDTTLLTIVLPTP